MQMSSMADVQWSHGNLAAYHKRGSNQKKIFYDILPFKSEPEGDRMKTDPGQENQRKEGSREFNKQEQQGKTQHRPVKQADTDGNLPTSENI